MVYFHGSPLRLEPGTILLPGAKLQPPRSTNGADSTAVFASSSEGYTLDEVLLEDRLGARDLIGYAARNAFYWGACCEDEHERSTFVHLVEPLGAVEWDPLAVTLADRRMPAARVLAVYEAHSPDEAGAAAVTLTLPMLIGVA